MPARIGTPSARVAPARPWQALHENAFAKPGVSIGPAVAPAAAPSVAARAVAMTRARMPAPLRKDVGPDAGRPRRRVLGVERGLARGQLLLDLHDLAVVDPVGVDDGHRLRVAHPRIAGVDRWHLRRGAAVDQ